MFTATSFPLKSKVRTGRSMHAIVEKFYRDIGDWSTRPLTAWFEYVKNIPYKRDPVKGVEVTARPAVMLSGFMPAADCKKKAILIASWFRANEIPFRFLAVSEREDKKIHHVFPQGWDGKKWVTADATYAKYRLGEAKPKITRAQELPR